MGPRVGAGSYLLLMSLAVIAWCLAMVALYYWAIVPKLIGASAVEYAVWALAAPVGYAFFYLSRRRLQDLNCPGRWAGVLAFPFVGVIILPLLCFLSSPRYANEFGDSPGASGLLKVLAALVSFTVALVLVPLVTRLYAPLHLHGAF